MEWINIYKPYDESLRKKYFLYIFEKESKKLGEKYLFNKFPKEKKWVLLLIKRYKHLDSDQPNHIMVGYLKYYGGDKRLPYFVIPGAFREDEIMRSFYLLDVNKYEWLEETINIHNVISYCDCLKNNFVFPKSKYDNYIYY